MSRVIGVIPARFASTRFPGKPLAKILGKPLLQWVIEGAKTSTALNEVWVATDHEEIAGLARSLGVIVKMTDSDLPTGSDRIWQAVANENVDVVVNIQGDEPLISSKVIDPLVAPMLKDPGLSMATLGRPLQSGDLESITTAKIVMNKNLDALYFSRFPIPYSREKGIEGGCLKHIGLYAYRKSFLKEFCAQKPVAIEMAEGLEQLRALYLGARIRVVEVNQESWGVDTPEDIKKVEQKLIEVQNA